MESHTHSARSSELVVHLSVIQDTDYVFFANRSPVVRFFEDIIVKEPGFKPTSPSTWTALDVPCQTLVKVDVAPVVYKFQVEATAGLSFEAVLTVGPPPVVWDHDQRLLRYARYISQQPIPIDISGLVQGKVRSICRALIARAAAAAAGPITMELVNYPPFKQKILDGVAESLSEFGLMVYHFDFDAALKLPYFSKLVTYTGQAKQNILDVKELQLSYLNNQLSLPSKVFNHLLGTSGAKFEPGVGLKNAQASQDPYKLKFNVVDDRGIIRELTCRVRSTGVNPKPEISDGWKQFVYDWNLKLGDFLIFYEILDHEGAILFTGVRYKIGVVRVATSP